MKEVVTGVRCEHATLRGPAFAVPADSRSARRLPHQTRRRPIAPSRKAMRRASLREQPGVTTVTRPASRHALARIRTETPCGTAPSRQRVYQFHHQGGARNIESFGREVQAVLAKSLRAALPSLARLFLAIAGWRLGRQRMDESPGDDRHVIH